MENINSGTDHQAKINQKELITLIFKLTGSIILMFIIDGCMTIGSYTGSSDKNNGEISKNQIDPSHDYRLKEGYKFSIGAEHEGKGYKYLTTTRKNSVRAEVEKTVWTQSPSGDITLGVDIEGSQTDGSRNKKLAERYGLFQKELKGLATISLHQRKPAYFEGYQINWNLKAGLGAVYRKLKERETLFAGSITAGMSARPSLSKIGGFFKTKTGFKIEKGGHIADLDLEVDIGGEIYLASLLKRIRIFMTLRSQNYGDLYKENQKTMETVYLDQFNIGGGIEAQIGDTSIYTSGKWSPKTTTDTDTQNGEKRNSGSAWSVEAGLKMDF